MHKFENYVAMKEFTFGDIRSHPTCCKKETEREKATKVEHTGRVSSSNWRIYSRGYYTQGARYRSTVFEVSRKFCWSSLLFTGTNKKGAENIESIKKEKPYIYYKKRHEKARSFWWKHFVFWKHIYIHMYASAHVQTRIHVSTEVCTRNKRRKSTGKFVSCRVQDSRRSPDETELWRASTLSQKRQIDSIRIEETRSTAKASVRFSIGIPFCLKLPARTSLFHRWLPSCCPLFSHPPHISSIFLFIQE